MSAKKYWNSRVKNLDPYTPGEQPKGTKVIKLNTNENPYPPSPAVLDAIQNAANGELRLYPDPTCTELRTAIAERYNVQIENVFTGNGSDEVLAFAFGAFFEPQNTPGMPPLLFPDITYSFYPVYAALWNIKYKQIGITDDFSIDVKDYFTKASGVVFPNPNAPTGKALSAKEILSVAEYQKDNIVIVDEAYYRFGAQSVVPFIKDHPNILTIHTLSKSESLAGLRAGFAIGAKEQIRALESIRDSFNSYTLDRIAQAGAAAGIRDAAYYDDIIKKIVGTRERISSELRVNGWTVVPSSANFILIKAPGSSGEAVFNKLRENNIIVRHFKKDRIKDFVRVSIGTDNEMDEFLSVCKKIQTENYAGGVENHRSREEGLIVYPVFSRRSDGLSIGINLWTEKKVCSFDCPYCEVFDFHHENKFLLSDMKAKLDEAITRAFKQGIPIKDICFSGNGEPTMSKDFPSALDEVIKIRNKRAPNAEIVVITNATGFIQGETFNFLTKAVRSGGVMLWVKIDAGTEYWYNKIDASNIPFEQLTKNIKAFAGIAPFIIQTMHCTVNSEAPSDTEISAWCDFVVQLAETGNIKCVQIYGKARPSPHDPVCAQLPLESLNAREKVLKEKLELNGFQNIPVKVFE